MKFLFLALTLLTTAQAEQFVLFDETFTFEEKDAVPTKSQLFVHTDKLVKDIPKDWTDRARPTAKSEPDSSCT